MLEERLCIFTNEYKKILEVYCPYFKEKISFNSKGFRHLKFKEDNKARYRDDLIARIKNFKFAPIIISSSHTLQERQTKYIFVNVKTNSRKEKILKCAEYYAFIAILRDGNYEKRLKVIVRQVEGGTKHFWSIIPFWSKKEGKLKSARVIWSCHKTKNTNH